MDCTWGDPWHQVSMIHKLQKKSTLWAELPIGKPTPPLWPTPPKKALRRNQNFRDAHIHHKPR